MALPVGNNQSNKELELLATLLEKTIGLASFFCGKRIIWAYTLIKSERCVIFSNAILLS